jgi:hypothetical protein
MTEEAHLEKALDLVREHLRRYPKMRPSDIYKLLYHACMGPEHAITDLAAAEEWLLQEWSSLSENPDERLYEDLTLHHPIYRINLRPAKSGGVEPSSILGGFAEAGKRFPKRPDLLANAWAAVLERIKSGEVTIYDAEDINGFDAFVRKKEFPAMHHSPEYVEEYRPAYRLVDRKTT